MGIKTCLQTVESTAEGDWAGAHGRQGEVEGLPLSCVRGWLQKKSRILQISLEVKNKM